MSKKKKRTRADGPTVVLYPTHEYATERMNHFAHGLTQHGVDWRMGSQEDPENADLAVVWGMRNEKVIARQKDAGADFLVLEQGYFGGRARFTAAGFGGLNGRSDFLNAGAPPDRWKKHGRGLDAWKPGAEQVLLIGQLAGDAATAEWKMPEVYGQMVIELRKHTDLPIAWRPHPLDPHRPAPAGARMATGTLREALRKSTCAVMLNSNAGVDAVLAGCPVIAVDAGSMAWDVAGHQLADVADPPTPDRAGWAYSLAYCQWNNEEMAAGDAWEHLRRKWES